MQRYVSSCGGPGVANNIAPGIKVHVWCKTNGAISGKNILIFKYVKLMVWMSIITCLLNVKY